MVNNLENGGLKRLCDFEGYSKIQNGYFYNKNSGTFHNGNGTLQALTTEKVSILSNFSKKDMVEFERICKNNLIEGMEVEPFIEMVHVRDSKGNSKRINAFDFKFPYREYSSYVKSYEFHEYHESSIDGPIIGLKPTNFELKWVADFRSLPTDILGVALYDVIMEGIPQYTVKLPFLKPSLSDYERFDDHGRYGNFDMPFYPMLDLGDGRYLFPQNLNAYSGENKNKMVQVKDKYGKSGLVKWNRFRPKHGNKPYIFHKGTSGAAQPFIEERWNMDGNLEFYEYDVLGSTIEKYDTTYDIAVAVLAANGVGVLKYYIFEPIPSYRNKDNQARYKEHIEKIMNKYFSLK